MKPSLAAQTPVAALLALVITGLFYLLDLQIGHGFRQNFALQLARQVASQVEGMALHVKQRNEPDSLSWAIKQMGQGVEPRVLLLSKISSSPGFSAENYQYLPSKDLLDYQKILNPENGQGVRVRVQMDFLGFLGTRSPVQNDFYVLGFFVLVWGFTLVVFRRRAPSLAKGFGEHSRSLLLKTGTHIRELVREARNLASAAGRSRGAAQELRSRIHLELGRIRKQESSLDRVEKSCVDAEVMALNLILDSSKASVDPEALKLQLQKIEAQANDLHRLLIQIRKQSQKSKKEMSRVELQLEPWAVDADLAFHSYDDVGRATEAMDSHIRNTTQSILGHANYIQAVEKPGKSKMSA